MHTLWRWLDRYYPLRGTGTLVFLVSMAMLGVWNGTGSFYAMALFISSLLSLFVLGLLGRAQAIRSRDLPCVVEVGHPLFARLEGQHLLVSTGRSPAFLFFRYHYRLKGKLRAGRKASLSVYAEGASREGGVIPVALRMPFCGPARLSGSLMLHDVFGLTRVMLAGPDEVNLIILPPLFPDRSPIRFEPSSSQESSRKVQTADEEKYYMREYIPGDRLKDINWKTSLRIDELVTRISPKSPEQTHLVHVDIRSFHGSGPDGPEALLHLNYMKSWALSFLRAVKQNHPEYRFQVLAGPEVHLIEDEDDLRQFSRHLAALEYSSESAGMTEPSPASERFVFSTAFDSGLSAYLRRHPSAIWLFCTSKGSGRKVSFWPSPDLSALPGPWIFRREKAATSAPAPLHGKLIEEKLALRIL